MKSLGKLVSVTLVGSIFGSTLRYGFNILLGRSFGPETLGLFSLGLMLINLGSMIAILGLDNAAQKYIPLYLKEDNKNKLSGILLLCLGTPVFIGGTLSGALIIAFLLDGFPLLSQFDIEIILFLIGIPLYALMRIGAAATRGFKQAKYSVYIQDVCQPLSAIIIAIVVSITIESQFIMYSGYIFSIALSGILSVYFLYIQGGFRGISDAKFDYTRVFSFSVPLILIAFSNQLISWVDVIMLGVLEPAAAVGLYQAAFQTVMILLLVLGASNAIFPAIAADLYHRDQYDRLEEMYTSLTKWIFSIALFGYLLISLLSSEILYIFGPEFVVAQTPLIILGFGQLFVAGTGPAGYLLIMSNNQKIEVINTMLFSLLNMILNYIMISQIGLLGAAIATGTSLASLNILRVIQIRNLLGIHPYSLSYWKGVAAACGVVPIYIGGAYLPLEGITKIMIIGSVSFILFLLILWLLGIDEEDRTLFNSAIK